MNYACCNIHFCHAVLQLMLVSVAILSIDTKHDAHGESWNPDWCGYVLTHTLRWRRNGHGGVSNHQPHHCLLNRLFGCRSKKPSKLRVTDLCAGSSPGPVNSPHKWPVTRKLFPFDDVIMSNPCNWICKLFGMLNECNEQSNTRLTLIRTISIN